jgi:hypothetical protein
MAADGTLTLDILRESIQKLREAEMDFELDILLQDNGPGLLLLLHGGRLVEVDGKQYVLAKEFFDPPEFHFGWRSGRF